MKKKIGFLFLLLVAAVPGFAQVSFSTTVVSVPHIVVGGDPGGLNYVTLLQVVNDNSFFTIGNVTIYSDTGTALSASFDGQAPQSAFSFTLESGQTRQISVTLSGAITVGWMQISYSPSDAETTVILQYRSGTTVLTEVGVNPTYGAMASTDFPAETDTNLNTGIAIASPSTAGAVLVRLWDPSTGNLLSSTTLALAANAHIARLLTELFPSVSGIGQIRAQVSLDSCPTSACTTLGSPGFIATAIRLNGTGNSFTAIPVIQSPSGGDLVRALPQIVVGGDPGGQNFQTILYMTTTAAGGVSGTADVLNDNGLLIAVTANGSATSGHFNFSVFSNRVTKIVLSGSAALQAGWVRLTLPGSVPLIVNAVFQTYSGSTLTSEASVLESPALTENVIYVSGTDNIGVALSNPQATQNTVSLTLFDQNGNIGPTANVTLQPYGHLARFVSELFPQYASQPNFGGTLSMQSPMAFASVALRLTGGNIATLPVANNMMFRPSITNLTITGTQAATGQVTFNIAVQDFSANNQPPSFLASSTSAAINAGGAIFYIKQNVLDPPNGQYYSVLIDGTSMINAASGTLTGTFQGGYQNIPSGTTATLYILIEDSFGNLSNVVSAPVKF